MVVCGEVERWSGGVVERWSGGVVEKGERVRVTGWEVNVGGR